MATKKSASKSVKKPIKDNIFSSYIHRILKNVHPDIGISEKGMAVLSRVILFFVRRYATECSALLISGHKKTLDLPTVIAATYIIFSDGILEEDRTAIANRAIKEIEKHVELFEKYNGKSNEKHRKEFQAGLQLSISRVKRVYKETNASSKRISDVCTVAIASTLEYLLMEVVELAGNASRDNKRARIIPRHLLLAIINDQELNTIILQQNCILGSGGVMPNIYTPLLPTKSG